MTSRHQWRLDGELTIREVAGLARVPPMTEPDRHWFLDLSGVREVDGAGLQWLLELDLVVRAAGGRLAVTALSDPLDAALKLSGIGRLLSPGEASDDE
ncbi:MAG: STAS domain-containing protein [Halothiobacillaceae bacterium]